MQPYYRCVLLAALAAGGCQAVPSTDSIGRDIARITQTATAIEYRTEGDQPDLGKIQTGVLSISEAVQLALEHDPELQIALARVRVALAEARQTRLLPNPVLNIALKFPESAGKPIIETSLTAELLSLIQRPRQISAADTRVRAAASEVLTQALDAVSQLQERYTEVQATQAEIAVLEDRRKILQQLVSIADARLKHGEAARLDQLSLSAQRAELDTDILEKQAELVDGKLALARLVGKPLSDIAWTVETWSASEKPKGTESQWIEAAMERRPELQAIKWELRALGDEEALERWSFFQGGAGVAADRDGGWSVGPALELPLPIFDWGQARRDKARAQIIAGRHKLTQTQRQIIEDVRRAWSAWQLSQQALAAVENSLIPLQEQRRAQAESQYRNGVADTTAVLLAEQDGQAAKSRLITLQKTSTLAFYRLRRAAAGSVESTSQPAQSAPATLSQTEKQNKNIGSIQ